MNTDVGVPGSPILQGTIVPSTQTMIAPGDTKAHAFFNVVRNILRATPAYHDEQALEAAVTAVDDFEKHILTGSHHAVLSEEDPAPREDVSQRVPPQPGRAIVPVAGPSLDYNRLAAAIVALQQQQSTPDDNTEGASE